MTWTAPEAHRVDRPKLADERAALDSFLDYHRQTLLRKCSGLTAEQLKRRAVASSTLTLLGLVRHLTEVERGWFRRGFAGEQADAVYFTDENPDADFDSLDSANAEADFAAYQAEIGSCRTAVAGRRLDETFVHPRSATEISLRWVYLHMLEEYARHNGHADLLREAIDGATGE
jgi:uncharacterized damage-inducible protein DinB